MRLNINWKAGILSAITVAIVGIGFFILIGSNIDYSCKNTTPTSAGCKVYNGFNTAVQGYTNIWRHVFAPRCVGGNGPNDCLGPDGMIMFLTLLVIGFVGGNLIFPKKKKEAAHL